MSLNDEYTGNQNIGKAAQTDFMDFWAIATAQSIFWKEPYTMSNLHAAETMLIQLGAEATGYIENSSLEAALIGIKFEFATPAVATIDVIPGSSIEIDMANMEMTTNKAFLSGTRIKANESLEAHQLLNHCRAAMSEATTSIANMESGAFSASLAQALRV